MGSLKSVWNAVLSDFVYLDILALTYDTMLQCHNVILIIHDYLSIFESLENGEISTGKSEKESVTLVKTLVITLNWVMNTLRPEKGLQDGITTCWHLINGNPIDLFCRSS